jgi:hypothetical protein
MLARELAKVKPDSSQNLAEKIDLLNDELDDASIRLHEERSTANWYKVLSALLMKIDNDRWDLVSKKVRVCTYKP